MTNVYVAALALASLAFPVLAQSTQMPPPSETGARPGNEMGTGSSLPRSDRASNIISGQGLQRIAPNLPSPPVGENADPRAYLQAARQSLASSRTGMAQQSLEMAETRLLDRDVPQGSTNEPTRDVTVQYVADARRALGEGNIALAMQLIDRALAR